MSEKVKCDKCGGEYSIGDWPFCTGDPEMHTHVGKFFHDGFEPYVDADILQPTDPRCQHRNEIGRKGILIESRSQRKKLMKEQGLDYGSNFHREF